MWLGRCIFVLLLLVTVSSYTVFVLMTKSKDQSNWSWYGKISWDIWINFFSPKYTENTSFKFALLLCEAQFNSVHSGSNLEEKIDWYFLVTYKICPQFFLVKRTQFFGTPCTVCIPFILNRYSVASLCPRSRPPPPPWRCVRPGREWRSSLVSVLSRKLE